MSIAKVDVDVKMSEALQQKWIDTRLAIIERLGYLCVKYRGRGTEKGYHFWFYIWQTLTDRELAELQFLLGDDQDRCRFNFLRLDLGAFRDFNALFSHKRKVRVEKEGCL